MTNIKKIQNAKNQSLKSYDNFVLDINKYFNKRLILYDKKHKEKLEKIENKLYFLTLKKDLSLENALKFRNQLQTHYKNKLKKLQIQLEDLKLNKTSYEKKLKNIKKKYKDGNIFIKKYKNKIKKINSIYEIKRNNLKNIHKIKKINFAEYRKKYEKKEIKIKQNSLKNLENKKNMVFDANKKFLISINQKISVLKNLMINKKKKLKEKLDKRIIGIHSFNKKIKNLEKKFENKINILNYKKSNNSPFVLNKEILSSKAKRLFNENNNKFFFFDVFHEMKNIVLKNKIIFIILVLLFYTALNNSAFWNVKTFSNIMRNNSEVIILGLSMTMVILTGGIDLSVGSLMAFSGVIICNFAQNGSNIWMSIILGIVISTLIGLGQGLLIGYARMVPFVVTLGGLLAYRGSAVLVANARPIQPTGDAHNVLKKLSNSEFLGINIQIWVIIICFLIFLFILKFTVFGRQIYAIGSNRRAAFLSGVKDKKIEAIVYMLSGFMAGLAGLLISARTQSISPTTGNAWELQAIAAVVIGGTALTGGKGGVIGTIIGWFILSSLQTTFITLGLNPNIQKVSTGIIIIISVLLNNNLDFKGGFIGIKKRFKTLFKQYFMRRKI